MAGFKNGSINFKTVSSPISSDGSTWVSLYAKNDGNLYKSDQYGIEKLVNITGGSSVTDHNSLSNLDGGQPGQYFHLTSAQANDFIGKTEVSNISSSLLSFSYSVSGNAFNQSINLLSPLISSVSATNITQNDTLTQLISLSGALQYQINNIPIPAGTAFLTGGNTFYGNQVIYGNVSIVSGSLDQVSVGSLNVNDQYILTNSSVSGSPILDGGLQVRRGVSSNAIINWNETTDKWEAGLVGSANPIVSLNSSNVGNLNITGTVQISGVSLFTNTITVDNNPSEGVLPSPLGGSRIVFANTNSAFNRLSGEGFDNTGLSIAGRRTSGTRTAMSATPANGTITVIESFGHDGTSYVSTRKASYEQIASKTWSSTDNSTDHVWRGTSELSTSTAEWMRLHNSNLGIGTVTPSGKLHVENGKVYIDMGSGILPQPSNINNNVLNLSTTDSNTPVIETYSFNAGGATIKARVAGGTRSIPTATSSDVGIIQLSTNIYDGTNWNNNTGLMRMLTDGVQTSGNRGCYYTFIGTNNGSITNAEWLRLQNGNIGINNPNPTDKLHVVGNATVIGNISGTGSIVAGTVGKVKLQGQASVGDSILWMMYNTANNKSYIQSEQQGIAYRELLLNPNGGNVGVGTLSPSGRFHVVDGPSSVIFNTEGSNSTFKIGSSSNVYSQLTFNTNSSDQVTISGSSYGLAIGGIAKLNIGYANANYSESLRVNGTALFGGEVIFTPGDSSQASINLPHGTAPTSPVNGDMWTTSNGVFAQVNNSTLQLGASIVISGAPPVGNSNGAIWYVV